MNMLAEALRLAQARVNLAHRHAPTRARDAAQPERDPVLYLVAASDGDDPVGVATFAAGLDGAMNEALRVGGTKEVLAATITPLGHLSELDITNLRQHLLRHPYGGI